MQATVIVPTFGRPQSVKAAMRSLLELEPQRQSVEILVVDNNSDQALSSDLHAACKSAGDGVRYVAEPSPGLTAARHKGAREARGAVLIFIDDDVQLSEGWLRSYLHAFADEGLGMAGGPSIPLFTASIPPWLWEYIGPTPYGGWHCGWLSLLDIGRAVEAFDPTWIWGLNFAIRRDLLSRLRGFHPDLVPPRLQRWQGDGETGLSLKAAAAGVRCAYVPGALLQHVVGADRLTPEYFARRAYYQGVCDSFTRIRAGSAPSPASSAPKPVEKRSWLRRKVESAARDVKARTDSAYRDGWTFHQTEAAADSRLLQWIRRADYWECDIREEA